MRIFQPLALLASLIFLALPLPAAAVELVMVEQTGCFYCRQWDKDISTEYPKTAEGHAAPLSRVMIGDTRKGTTGYSFARPVVYTPTFVLVDDAGTEMARLEGYAGEDFWWGLLGMMLKAQIGWDPEAPAPAATEAATGTDG